MISEISVFVQPPLLGALLVVGLHQGEVGQALLRGGGDHAVVIALVPRDHLDLFREGARDQPEQWCQDERGQRELPGND
jgi:hypothetical protein